MTLQYEDIKERLVALTRDLMLIPSIPSRPEERARCYAFIKNHLESLDSIEIREFEDRGFPSLVAVPARCKNPDILMCGHLDVITHPDISVYTSRIGEGRICGPGSGDMKGSLAILLEIFRQVHTLKPNASLGIAVTSDEETGGESGIGFLVKKKGISCKAALIPDGGSLDKITVEEKGILHLKVTCGGRTAHAARPWLGNNPIEHLCEKLGRLGAYFEGLKEGDGHWYPTCSVTIISTENQTINRIPKEAEAVLDIRFPPPHNVKGLLKMIGEVLGPEIAVEVIISAEPAHLSPDGLYQSITAEVTGKQPELIKDDGGSDARFFAAKGIPVMMSRPLVGNLHSEDEWIDIESMLQFYRIYEQYLLQKL